MQCTGSIVTGGNQLLREAPLTLPCYLIVPCKQYDYADGLIMIATCSWRVEFIVFKVREYPYGT